MLDGQVVSCLVVAGRHGLGLNIATRLKQQWRLAEGTQIAAGTPSTNIMLKNNVAPDRFERAAR